MLFSEDHLDRIMAVNRALREKNKEMRIYADNIACCSDSAVAELQSANNQLRAARQLDLFDEGQPA